MDVIGITNSNLPDELKVFVKSIDSYIKKKPRVKKTEYEIRMYDEFCAINVTYDVGNNSHGIIFIGYHLAEHKFYQPELYLNTHPQRIPVDEKAYLDWLKMSIG